ncbi:mitochondrial substrate carrier family protein V-like [Actinia tenebrosa]|uniref:Mitochondrial substrate carrier family protein V-like n=1 Tax=Actinia tenebrosa TaxID=6105 RepID=A0A6P8IFM6_ACTTE|nr:mitochondrial substrate carrier family protein V-like [Actinia tenebrosa]
MSTEKVTKKPGIKSKVPEVQVIVPKEQVHSYKQFKHLVAGGVAGAVSRTCVSPFERLKILLQIQVTDVKFRGIIPSLIKIGKEEGILGYFKGNGTNVIRIIPYCAVQFAAYEEYKKLLKIPEDHSKQTPGKRLVAGAMAGVTSITATYPLDLVRTRLSVQLDGTERKYRGIIHAFQTILKEEGGFFSGCLYKGLVPTALGIAPYVGLNFAVYETLKGVIFSHLASAQGTRLKVIKRDHKLPIQFRLLCGSVAGAISQSFTYPLDVVRRRMQMKGLKQHEFAYRSTLHAFVSIVQKEGVRGLYKGILPNLIKVAPAVGIQFVVYETVKSFMYGQPVHFQFTTSNFLKLSAKLSHYWRFLPKMTTVKEDAVSIWWEKYIPKGQLIHLVAGGVAGGVSRTCVSPLERVKMLLQIQTTGPNVKYSGVAGTLAKIYTKEGLIGYFKGNGTNIVRIVPYTAVQFAAYEEFKKLFKIPTDIREQHPVKRLAAGASAGIVSATVTYPLDLIRTRLACQGEGAERKYRNIRHAFVTIIREEGGLFSNCLFKGLGPTLIGIAPYIGLNFMVYETLKGFCLKYYLAEAAGHKLRVIHHDQDLPVVAKLGCGAVAGAVAQSGTYPLDVVRRRMQMEGAVEGLFKYNSTWDAFKVIITTEGIKGLFKGMWPNLLKVAPTIGIQFAIYEISKTFLMDQFEVSE